MTRHTTARPRDIAVILLSVGVFVVLSLAFTAPGLGNSFGVNGVWESGPGIANHPVGVVPSAAVNLPSGWPLDAGGSITCLTCHTQIPSISGDSGPKLRGSGLESGHPIEFCAACHSLPDQNGAGSIHWIALGVAHIPADLPKTHAIGGALDLHTRQCLSCHDGATAMESENEMPYTRASGFSGDMRTSHPVGVRYDHFSRSADLSPLRPASLLPPGVPLPDGKVACISCHNLYAGDRHLLTVPIQGSRLCLTCHEMD